MSEADVLLAGSRCKTCKCLSDKVQHLVPCSWCQDHRFVTCGRIFANHGPLFCAHSSVLRGGGHKGFLLSVLRVVFAPLPRYEANLLLPDRVGEEAAGEDGGAALWSDWWAQAPCQHAPGKTAHCESFEAARGPGVAQL